MEVGTDEGADVFVGDCVAFWKNDWPAAPAGGVDVLKAVGDWRKPGLEGENC